MKIGLLTFHRANNLGAVLQASALQKYIKDNYGNCQIIDYFPNNDVPVQYKGIKKYLRLCKHMVLSSFLKNRNIQEHRFEEYRNEYFNLTDQYYYGDKEIDHKLENFDMLISGSDQILNTTLTGCSKAYYLSFFEGKKISYASSFGRNDISSDEIQLINSELSKFTALSVREQSAGQIISEQIGVKPELVMDPVFLLEKEEWTKRCNMDIKLPEHFIFVYSMEVSEALENTVNLLKNDVNMPVIVVRGGGKAGRITGVEDETCGPKEFLRYIKDADYVITNSFHGTAFSLIFEKLLLCVAHSTRNTRLENILELINESDKMITSVLTTYKSNVINGSMCNDTLGKYINNSKEFLKIISNKQERDNNDFKFKN